MSERRLAILGCLCLFAIFSGCGRGKFRYSSADIYYEEAQKALEKGGCFKATQLFRNLLSDFPGSHLVDDAQFGLGEAGFCSRDYLTAIFEYERLLNEYPASPFVDKARYQIGMCYYKQSRDVHHDQEDTQKAIREFRRFVEDFPTSEWVSDAQKRIGELRNKLAAQRLMIAENYLKWQYLVSAQLYCEGILEDYGETEVAGRTRFVLAQAKRRLGELDEAMEALMRLAADDLPPDLKKEIMKEIEKVQEEIVKRGESSAPSAVDRASTKHAADGK